MLLKVVKGSGINKIKIFQYLKNKDDNIHQKQNTKSNKGQTDKVSYRVHVQWSLEGGEKEKDKRT